jgi:hypothetical protein
LNVAHALEGVGCLGSGTQQLKNGTSVGMNWQPKGASERTKVAQQNNQVFDMLPRIPGSPLVSQRQRAHSTQDAAYLYGSKALAGGMEN